MNKGSWAEVDWREVVATLAGSATIGAIRLLYLLRKGKKRFHWFDLVLEPCLAVFGGMLLWALTEVTDTPDVIQAVFTSLGAWGGPRTIHWAEMRYFGKLDAEVK